MQEESTTQDRYGLVILSEAKDPCNLLAPGCCRQTAQVLRFAQEDKSITLSDLHRPSGAVEGSGTNRLRPRPRQRRCVLSGRDATAPSRRHTDHQEARISCLADASESQGQLGIAKVFRQHPA